MSSALAHFSWLGRFSRPILVRGNDVKVLYSPNEFYGTLMNGLETAEKRVVLSSLYLGTGEKSQELVSALSRALSDPSRPSLQCTVLLDCLRGTRGTPNSVTALLPLLSLSLPPRLTLRLYHTPNLRGMVRRVVPERFNEGMGLQHTKMYLFDDTVMLSGANLSEDYFTNRQDRYVVFSHSPQLADYFSSLTHTLAAHSLDVSPDGSLSPALGFDHLASRQASHRYRALFSNVMQELMPTSDVQSSDPTKWLPHNIGQSTEPKERAPSCIGRSNEPTEQTTSSITQFIDPTKRTPYNADHSTEPTNWTPSSIGHSTKPTKRILNSSTGSTESRDSSSSSSPIPGEVELEQRVEDESDLDTAVYPLLQMGLYGIRQEESATRALLEGLRPEERLFLASGYFNLPPQYSQALLEGEGHCSVLAASPQAFGFFGAKGIAGHVPVMYTHFARQFLQRVSTHRAQERVLYSEYSREGWTFHGKGMWYYLAQEQLPSLTLVGSSNYGHRSLTRDLEAQVAVVTSNSQLRAALHKEQKQMFSYGQPLSLADVERAPNRKLKLWQWIVTMLLKRHV